ncbi:ArsR family transcriptional regulator [Candidatus Woesearchaeota archaeon]|nr:ArsR family transcriptional regulator [Candidatus Woesearchaeota archaeon]
MVIINGESAGAKRPFIEIRNSILECLASGQKTINQISGETQINWKTVERHLTYLVGKGWVREAFSSAYVRIFELTAFGKDHLRKNFRKGITLVDKKIIRLHGVDFP